MAKRSSRVIKRILKEHFDGFWKFHSDLFPEFYRKDIKETVQKTIKCETRDLGYAKYECFGCFTCKSCFCHKCGKNIRMIERSGWCRI